MTNKQQGPSPYAPTDPANGLSAEEIDGILEYKRQHPSYGPAQLRAQLKRFRGWRISLKAIAKVALGPGEEAVLEFRVGRRDLEFVGLEHRWVFEPGLFRFTVGGMTRELELE